jgi:hypothetical protein
MGGSDGATCFVYSETGKPIVMKNILGPSIIPGGRLQGEVKKVKTQLLSKAEPF